MSVQVIHLFEEDDIVSIGDQLNWVQEPQVVLVLPPKGVVLTRSVDLALLRRRADEQRLEVGLVTTDHRVTSQAKEIGIPTFPSLRMATRNRRRWWRGRRQKKWAGQPLLISSQDRAEVKKRRSARPDWQRWSMRYLAIILYIITLAVLFVTAVYTIPGATVKLEPELQSIEVRRQIVVDPLLEAENASGSSVPGRVLTSIQEWQADVETTGIAEVADASASGRVAIFNRVEEPVTVPAGTRVRTSTGNRIVFQTMEPVEIPGVVGGTAEVDIVAIEPGLEGNVRANLINRLEGPLNRQLEVRNLQPTSGGGVRLEQAVTEGDQQRLKSQIMQQLQVRALAEMEGQLSDREFLARDSLRLIRTLQETYSHFPGEQTDRLALEIRAELQATAVDESQAVSLVYEELVSSVAPGFELVPESLHFSSGSIIDIDGEGRVTFEMIGGGLVAARLTVDELLNQIAGHDIGVAAAYLYERLPLRDYPTVRVWPDWFGRLPYLPVRIRTQIDTGIQAN